MTPEEFAAKIRAARGITLTGTPVTPIPDTPIVPTPVQSVPIQPTAPVRTDVLPSPGGGPTDPNAPPVRMPDAAAVEAWRRGTPLPPAAVTPSTPAVAAAPPPVPRAFPVGGAEPTPYAPPGVSLTSAPAAAPAPGWEGSVGVTSPEAAKAYDAGKSYEKLMSGLDEMAKGLKPKAPQVQIPNLLAGAPEPNQSNQMAAQLMAAMLNKRGLTLTGR